ncbi:stage II sporulation protein D [Virgibacillus profundi]|uniref:Stage II sporulation protein D n=2 Tax=Virgibacillus profundi TaxID=2024555 RepID=A0A2A2IKM7_9BACI|nr:stage II sporulation protein D [Virgibacillus profundi]PXY55871.1 stage II sporulation protein D [Virgibacillus profundi]
MKKQLELKRKQTIIAKSNSTISHSKSPKKLTPFKPKKQYLTKKSATWRLPAVLLISMLITIILVVPTLIVTPFVTDNQQKSGATEIQPDSGGELDSLTSPFSVAVIRSKSETVEDVPLETYVSRVVASEMPAKFELEALKAQSLAARTYVINHILYQNGDTEYDVTDTTKHQVYKDERELQQVMKGSYTENMDKIKKAVQATEGEIITYKNDLITPAFFSTSNGYTENSEDYWENELPYLRSVESKWDEESPKFLDQKIFMINEVEKVLELNLPEDAALPIEVTRTESNRVDQLAIAENTFSGREIREKFELQSSDFTIEQKNDHLIFTTKGFGHGIGMSQYGANGMAKEGKTYKEIVKHYYKDVEVSTITDSAPTLVSK